MRIAPIHISLPVAVRKDRGVDVVPMLLLPNKWFAKRVTEWAVGRIAHQHADAVPMQRRIEVVLAVALHRLNCPSTIVATAPRKVFQRRHCSMLRPVDHVGGGPQQPVVHEESRRAPLVGVGDVLGRSVVRGVKEQRVAHHEWRRVGCVFGLEERHVHRQRVAYGMDDEHETALRTALHLLGIVLHEKHEEAIATVSEAYDVAMLLSDEREVEGERLFHVRAIDACHVPCFTAASSRHNGFHLIASELTRLVPSRG